MNRSRSVSRRPALRRRDEESSSISSTPRSSRSRSTSMASPRKAFSTQDNYDDDDDDDDDEEEGHHRSRSVSRGAAQHHGRQGTSSSSTLSKSAGVLAGLGIAALVAHKFWPRGGSYFGRDDPQLMRRGQHRHGYGEDYHGSSRDPQRRGLGQMASHYQYGAAPMRHGPRNHDGFGVYGREESSSSSSRRRNVDGRGHDGWYDDGGAKGRALQYTYIGTSPEQSSVGYGSRRHV